MIWTGWNNGEHRPTGAGYGFALTVSDRDLHFKPAWRSVLVELPKEGHFFTVMVSIAKESFWESNYQRLMSMDIGSWMRAEGIRRGGTIGHRSSRLNW